MTATAQVDTQRPENLRRTRDVLARRPIIVLSGVLVVLYVITATQDPSLWTVEGVRSVLLLACPLALMAAAQSLCMLTGGIDLSSAMIANFAAYVAAKNAGLGPVASLLLAVGVGIIIGAINGVGVGVFKVNPLIMTLGMSSVLLGIVVVGIAGTGFLSGSTRIAPVISTTGGGTLWGPIPVNSLVFVAVFALLILGSRYTGLGQNIYGVGDNETAVKLAGVRTWQVYLTVYVIAAVLAVIAGLVFSGIGGSVGPDQTNSYLLPAVAAAVIGGTSILGGSGGFAGTAVGALILTVLNRLLLSLDTSEAVRQVIYGVIVLALAWVYVRITGQRA